MWKDVDLTREDWDAIWSLLGARLAADLRHITEVGWRPDPSEVQTTLLDTVMLYLCLKAENLGRGSKSMPCGPGEQMRSQVRDGRWFIQIKRDPE